MRDIRVMLGIIFAFIVGFFVFIAKIRFVQKLIVAKVDINVFNLTLALCFVASGKNISLMAICFDNGWMAFLGDIQLDACQELGQ